MNRPIAPAPALTIQPKMLYNGRVMPNQKPFIKPLRLVSLFLLLALLTSCSLQPNSMPGTQVPSQTTLPVTAAPSVDLPATTPEDSLQETSPSLPQSTESAPPADAIPTEPTLPLARYTLTATLNYAGRHLQVNERIDYTNHSPDTLTDLVLMVEPLYYAGAFHLDRQTWGDGSLVENAAWDGARQRLTLPQPLQLGESRTLHLDFTIDLPMPTPSAETRPVPFGATERQINLVDWYPFIPPYQESEGWIAHQAGFFGEHLAYEVADFDVRFRIEDARPELTVAASAPGESAGEWTRYSLPAARNFVISVSHQYVVVSQVVDGVTVTGYHFPFHTQAGEAALKTTVEALQLFNQLFGPYPRSHLSVVEADFLDGMEYDGLYFLSNGFYNLYQGTPGEYLIAIAAHETAHQWWYARVGNDQALEPWLDEALCTYSERLFFERLYPEALDWWWAYRVNYYEPQGWVDGSIYNPLGYRAYRDAIYLNGALFLEELRQAMGDEAFLAFLKDYAQQNAGRIATGDDFFSVLSEHTSADLTPLIERYFQNR